MPNAELYLMWDYLDEAVKAGLIDDVDDEEFIKAIGKAEAGTIENDVKSVMRLKMLVESLEGTYMSYDDWLDDHPNRPNVASQLLADKCRVLH